MLIALVHVCWSGSVKRKYIHTSSKARNSKFLTYVFKQVIQAKVSKWELLILTQEKILLHLKINSIGLDTKKTLALST
jgi:hypothetical protein